MTELMRFDIWTECFLGTRLRGEALLEWINRMDGGAWSPDKWGHFEPIQQPYSLSSRDYIIEALTAQCGTRISNAILFKKRKPKALIVVDAWRGRVAGLNRIWLELDAEMFGSADGPKRIMNITLGFVARSQAVYATVFQSNQAHRRIAQLTPLERLERLDWLTFFGEPYIQLFGGRERVLKAPAYKIKDVARGVVITAAPRPDSPEMINSDETLLALERYFGADAFAGQGFPDKPCHMPEFDLSETAALLTPHAGQRAPRPGGKRSTS